MSQLAEQLKAPREELPERIEALIGPAARRREGAREAARGSGAGRRRRARRCRRGASAASALVAARVADGISADDLRKLAVDVRDRLRAPDGAGSVAVLVAVTADRPLVAAAVDDGARTRAEGGRAGRRGGASSRRRRRRPRRRRPGRRHQRRRSGRGARGRPRCRGGRRGLSRDAARRPAGSRRRQRADRRRDQSIRAASSRRRWKPCRATVAAGTTDVRRHRRVDRGHDAVEVVVGLPLSLTGARGAALTTRPTDFAAELAAAVAPDRGQTWSTSGCRPSRPTANCRRRVSGRSARRAVVDQAAAVIILQTALDAERASGRPPGELVTVSSAAAPIGRDGDHAS